MDSYNNFNQKRLWVMQGKPTQTPKAEIHRKKIIDAIIKEFCTLNFYQDTKQLIQICKFNNSAN